MKIFFHQKFSSPSIQQPYIILVDSKVEKKFSKLLKILKNNSKCLGIIPLTSGEKLKTPKSLLKILSQLNNLKCNKKTLLIAIGGGTLLDIAGLCANLWMRGISWHAYPTTILAQVDSCLGGKTAINFKNRKNLLGTIYPAKQIHLYHAFIDKLPRQLQFEGCSEICKHALLVNDTSLLFELVSIINMNTNLSQKIIKKSLLIKNKFLKHDLHEIHNSRIKLNLGHTFGHALEQLYPKSFNHGAAVWWGLKIELILSELLGGVNLHPAIRVINLALLKRENFKQEVKIILKNLDIIFKNATLDKKNNSENKITYIALLNPGKSSICHQLPKNAITTVKKALEQLT